MATFEHRANLGIFDFFSALIDLFEIKKTQAIASPRKFKDLVGQKSERFEKDYQEVTSLKKLKKQILFKR